MVVFAVYVTVDKVNFVFDFKTKMYARQKKKIFIFNSDMILLVFLWYNNSKVVLIQ